MCCFSLVKRNIPPVTLNHACSPYTPCLPHAQNTHVSKAMSLRPEHPRLHSNTFTPTTTTPLQQRPHVHSTHASTATPSQTLNTHFTATPSQTCNTHASTATPSYARNTHTSTSTPSRAHNIHAAPRPLTPVETDAASTRVHQTQVPSLQSGIFECSSFSSAQNTVIALPHTVRNTSSMQNVDDRLLRGLPSR